MPLPCCQQQRRPPTTRRSTTRNVRPVVSATRWSVFLFALYLLSAYMNWLQYTRIQIEIPNLENMNGDQGSFGLPSRHINSQNSRNSIGSKNEAGNVDIETIKDDAGPTNSRSEAVKENSDNIPHETKDSIPVRNEDDANTTEDASEQNTADDAEATNSKSEENKKGRNNSPEETISGPIHRENKRNITLSSSFLKQIEWKSRIPETKEHLMRLASEVDVEDLGMYLSNKSAYVYNPGPWDGAGIVMEDLKLVFFTQGKVACTVFKQLFRRMMNYSDWKVDNGTIPHNPGKNGLIYLYRYSTPDALTILTHPDWTRAIFVRDPKERTLSAYLDKAKRKKGKYVRRHCCNQKNSTCGEEASTSFLGFLRVIEERCCCDPHWRPQSRRIDPAFMPFINFVGNFDRIQVDTERLLKGLGSKTLVENDTNIDDKRIDLWTDFGASGWGEYGNQSIFSKDTKAKHQTSALTKLREYYNSTTETLVEKIFDSDYRHPALSFTRFSLFDEKSAISRNE